jgi:hypothetical protein
MATDGDVPLILLKRSLPWAGRAIKTGSRVFDCIVCEATRENYSRPSQIAPVAQPILRAICEGLQRVNIYGIDWNMYIKHAQKFTNLPRSQPRTLLPCPPTPYFTS